MEGAVREIAEMLKPAEGDSPEITAAKSQLQGFTENLQMMFDRGQIVHFSQCESGMGGKLAVIPGLAEKMSELRQSMQEELDRREKVKIAEMETLIAEVGETLKRATKPEDLDGLLLKLSQQKPGEYGNPSPQIGLLARQMQTAAQIVGNWQDYLIALETGNHEAARQNLQQISMQLSGTPIIPRSIVLRLLSPSPIQTAPENPDAEAPGPAVSLDEVTEALTETGDTATALERIRSVPNDQLVGSDQATFLRTLQSVDTLRKLEPAMAEAEVMANARTAIQSHRPDRLIFIRAIDQIIPNSIASKYGIEIPSVTKTSPRQVIESIATDAVERRDWPLLRRAIHSMENLNSGTHTPDSQRRTSDLKAISLIEVAEAAEQRNDLEAAAAAYLEANTIDGFYLRREVASSKLAELTLKAPDNLEPFLAKAEEQRARAEAAQAAAMMEARDRMMSNRMRPPFDRSPIGSAALRPLVQEAVAEFLKEKRLEAQRPPVTAPPSKEPTETEDSAGDE